MKKYAGLLKYFRAFRLNIFLYILFTLLSIVFGIVSIGMLIPFLDVLFDPEKRINTLPPLAFNASSILDTLDYVYKMEEVFKKINEDKGGGDVDR